MNHKINLERFQIGIPNVTNIQTYCSLSEFSATEKKLVYFHSKKMTENSDPAFSKVCFESKRLRTTVLSSEEQWFVY